LGEENRNGTVTITFFVTKIDTKKDLDN